MAGSAFGNHLNQDSGKAHPWFRGDQVDSSEATTQHRTPRRDLMFSEPIREYARAMNRSPVPARSQLRGIARRAMLERGLLPDFSPAVLAETNAMAPGVAEPGASVRDLRGLLWASIDNDDSRDLDQLSVAEPMAGGDVKVLVAIADVDATVKQGCAVDAHARANTTSVYTAAQIFPMLPERLSTDLTSLGEEQERLAIAIEMIVTEGGTVRASDVYRAVVRNRAKLAYDGVAAWLDGAAPAPSRLAAVPGMDEQLRMQDRVAQAMKGVRHQHGALDLETLEVRAVFDGDILAELRPQEKNRAKALIEDFMIAANGVTARYLDRKGFPSVRRVLRSPERWEKIVALAAAMGERLPSQRQLSSLHGVGPTTVHRALEALASSSIDGKSVQLSEAVVLRANLLPNFGHKN